MLSTALRDTNGSPISNDDDDDDDDDDDEVSNECGNIDNNVILSSFGSKCSLLSNNLK